MRVKKQILIVVLFIFSLNAHAFEADFIVDKSVDDTVYAPGSELITQIRLHLLGEEYADWAPDLNWDRLRRFYASRQYLPIWTNTDKSPTEHARLLRDAIIFAWNEGLNPAEYHEDPLRYMWRARREVTMARRELLLTDAFFRYVREVKAGYFYPKSVDFDWKLPRKKLNVVKQLLKYLASPEPEAFLAQLPPDNPSYKALKNALANYRTIALDGGWTKISHGPSLRIGDKGKRVKQVKQRLLEQGYLTAMSVQSATMDVFDATMEAAVKHYQKNNGHIVDGVVGGATRRSLNRSIKYQIAEIKKNMERWRWIPRDLGKTYVQVNMAAYELQMVENNAEVLRMPVIVGKTEHATPSFIDTMEYLEFNPSWNVPPRIAKEDFLPKLQEDSSAFLKANNLKVYNGWNKKAKEVDPEKIDWSKYSSDRWFPFKLEQIPGAHNSLGRIKFMFPNKYRVYIHDTPDKKLFDRYVRTFSSGCVRVSEPKVLAEKILEREGSWSSDKIQQIIDEGETKKVELSHRWPVYLLYWTAWVDEDGMVNFRRDVYGRNRLIAAGAEPEYDNLLLAQNSH
ncbi:MAG: L,D-transpeptidase family protein [Gammaproteobacteria bacterium]|nr:L,D-transpeptidase family protein [Gammaproteobacteria bacterium]